MSNNSLISGRRSGKSEALAEEKRKARERGLRVVTLGPNHPFMNPVIEVKAEKPRKELDDK